jgi:hypothetical protein
MNRNLAVSNTTICEEYVVQSAQGIGKCSTFVYLHCSNTNISRAYAVKLLG